MTTLLVGFDSAWTPGNKGAIAAAVAQADGSLAELGHPESMDFTGATSRIREWQDQTKPVRTVVLLDQPTVVPNDVGQRPVEHLVSSPISQRYGGVQPANRSRTEMFGENAPVWTFLRDFDCLDDPLEGNANFSVIETYPVLTMIALDWILPDTKAAHVRKAGRLPKYNPGRRKTFDPLDWRHVCERVAELALAVGLPATAAWAAGASRKESPSKACQDKLDACICLCVACFVAAGKSMLMIGDKNSGYIVVPDSQALRAELSARCKATGRNSDEWVRSYRRGT